MFENKLTHNGIHYSRYIASWKIAGTGYYSELFKDWLRSQELTEDEVRDIFEMATNGKLELQENAKLFLAEKKEQGYFGTLDERRKRKEGYYEKKGLA